MPVVQSDQLESICVDLLLKVGVEAKEAKVITDCLIEADLRGVSTHGVFRLPTYIKRVEQGLINVNPKIKIMEETSSTAIINGGGGFGQTVGSKAMELACLKAKDNSIGIVSAFNSNHFGIAAYYSMIALRHRMIGIAMANANPAMAPYGGIEKRLGTNPISFAIPAGEEQPVVLDMAMSKVSRGKIRIAFEKGKKIPKGWAIDKMGNPTEDPASALAGSLLPFGGPKGSGLSLIIDILTGVLSGGAFGRDVKSMYDMTEKSKTAHTMIAININSFIPIQKFTSRLDKLLKDVRNSAPAPKVEKILLPGMVEAKERRRLLNGIPISEKTLSKLLQLREHNR